VRTILEIIVNLGVYGDLRAVGRGDKMVPRIVVEANALSKNRGSIDSWRDRKRVQGEWQICRASLDGRHVAEPLTHRDLGHLIGIDPEFPVRADFGSGVVCLITKIGGWTKTKESGGGILEETGSEIHIVPPVGQCGIGITECELALNLLRITGTEPELSAPRFVFEPIDIGQRADDGVVDEQRCDQMLQIPLGTRDEKWNNETKIASIVLRGRDSGNGNDIGVCTYDCAGRTKECKAQGSGQKSEAHLE
jgi:hypothetical protein